MNIEKIKEIFADEAFVKGLFELETAAEVRVALKEKGVEMSEEEILGIRDLLIKVESGEISAEQAEQWSKQAESGELSEELLEQVAGGLAGTTILAIYLGILGGGQVLGCGIASAIAFRW